MYSIKIISKSITGKLRSSSIAVVTATHLIIMYQLFSTVISVMCHRELKTCKSISRKYLEVVINLHFHFSLSHAELAIAVLPPDKIRTKLSNVRLINSGQIAIRTIPDQLSKCDYFSKWSC